jgi:cell division septum initiation protein DivIVA
MEETEVDGFNRTASRDRNDGRDESQKRRAAGSRLGGLGDRVSKAFSKLDPVTTSREPNGAPFQVYDHMAPAYDDDPMLPRFPITRQGYDCDVVDQHVTELEAELAQLEREIGELRAHAATKGAATIEIERIGEQTSAILVAAHDEAQETIRLAELQAHNRIAEATSYAAAVTEEANVHLRRVEADKLSVSRERARLMDDIKTTASALTLLADDAAVRFPLEPSVDAPAASRMTSEPAPGTPPEQSQAAAVAPGATEQVQPEPAPEAAEVPAAESAHGASDAWQ